MQSAQDEAKRVAAAKAIECFLNGDSQDALRIGLGSGTTSRWFVKILGEQVKQGLKVVGVPTSKSTAELAKEVGITLGDLNEVLLLDFVIDGADEIDGRGNMIKGGGGNLLWEKIVAVSSNKMVVIVDDSKAVERLGRFPLPVEVVSFGWKSTEMRLRKLFSNFGWARVKIDLRGGMETPYLTDSGHYILDCHLEEIWEPEDLALELSQIPGVVEHGLFIGIAHAAVIGHSDGTSELREF
jgi:ribose 5-phosphate isomerase A